MPLVKQAEHRVDLVLDLGQRRIQLRIAGLFGLVGLGEGRDRRHR